MDQDNKNLSILGWACAVFLPLAGFLIGLAVIARGRTSTGLAIVGLSVVAAAVWYLIFFA